MVTARDFIAYVYIPLTQAWGYIYGTAGRMWTEALQQAWSQPGHKNYQLTKQYGSKWIGRMVTDCSGLLCWALKQMGAAIVHQARYQYTDASKRKGRLINGRREDGQPILPGTAVFLKGSQDHIHHVGVYVGHGVCIEAKGTRWGVVTSELTHWDYWGELKVVDYTDAEKLENEPAPEIPERKEDYEFKAVVDNPGEWLNVRQQPDEGSKRLFKIYKGDVVDVIDTTSATGWWQIKYSGLVGWASSKYLKRIEDDEPDEPKEDQTDDGNIKALVRELQLSINNIYMVLDTMTKTIEKLGGIQDE